MRTVLSGGGLIPMAGPPAPAAYAAYYAAPGYAPAAPYGGFAAPAGAGGYDAEQAYVNAEVAAGRIVAIVSAHRRDARAHLRWRRGAGGGRCCRCRRPARCGERALWTQPRPGRCTGACAGRPPALSISHFLPSPLFPSLSPLLLPPSLPPSPSPHPPF